MQAPVSGGVASGGVLHSPGALTLTFGLPQDNTMVQHQGRTQVSPQHLSGGSGVKIEEAHSTTNMNQQTNNPEMENQKKAIYRHPLFPLMALLFEKCEQATQTPDCPSTDSFDVDIQAFVRHQEQDCKPFFSDDPEMDGLMVKTIQVLRIHLLELEKVNDLCKDFCARYTSCLKGKLQSDNLLRVDGSTVLDPDSTAPELDTGLGPGQVVSGGTVYQMVHTAQGLVAQPVQQMQGQSPVSSPSAAQGNTPLSQIGLSSPPHQVNNMPVSSPALGSPSDFDDDDFNGRKSKRGVLPKQATLVMKSWLFQHIVHPYPTEDEKRQIASQTNLTLLQVNNWFINARRRILQPMLDASNPEGGNKAKKSKPASRPPQRFWPGNLASLQPGSSQASSPSSTTLDQDMQSDEDGFDDDEDDDDDDDDDSVGLPTPQQLSLPPGVSVTGEGQLVPTSSLSLLPPPASQPAPVPAYSHHQPYLSPPPPTNQLTNS